MIIFEFKERTVNCLIEIIWVIIFFNLIDLLLNIRLNKAININIIFIHLHFSFLTRGLQEV